MRDTGTQIMDEFGAQFFMQKVRNMAVAHTIPAGTAIRHYGSLATAKQDLVVHTLVDKSSTQVPRKVYAPQILWGEELLEKAVDRALEAQYKKLTEKKA